MPNVRPQPTDATLSQVLAGLASEGYDADFFVDDEGGICCRTCGTCTPADQITLDGLRRIEGASDPADMAAVLAVTCSRCGERGTAIVRYGPEAGPGDAVVLLTIDNHRGAGTDVADAASHDEPAASAPGGGSSADPEEPVGDFGDESQSDDGGDSDVEPPNPE